MDVLKILTSNNTSNYYQLLDLLEAFQKKIKLVLKNYAITDYFAN